jgi:hypothetical protein
MSLFDLQPLTVDEIAARLQRVVAHGSTSVTIKDKKGRAYRRRPYWIDLGKGPEGRTCKTCHYLVRTEYAKVYFKCGTWKITGGPGTQIATTDQACARYQREGLPMFSMKDDR